MNRQYQFDVRVQIRTLLGRKYLFGRAFTNVKYTNTTSRIRLAVYRNVFALIVEIDGYEGETRLQTKRATYKDIQAWVKERYGNLAISQTKELCGLAKTEYKGYGDAEGQPAPKLAAKKEAAIREAFIWFGLIEKE